MRALGFSETLAQWLASSLVPVLGGGASGGLTWAFDIKGDIRDAAWLRPGCSRAPRADPCGSAAASLIREGVRIVQPIPCMRMLSSERH